ncbi:MAG: nickel pincer cofactor biosynthesis protein LarC [Candidatus Bathyarchaeota archaeon]|nr:nickel pincer cofactor biosynthesis protein LarC [Candidatus Bathyarchaeota archaeon]
MAKINKILVIDCQLAGISGDMFLGALIDLGADVSKVTAAIKALEKKEYGYKNIKVHVQRVMRKGFKATKIDATAESTHIKSGPELITIVEESTKNLKLSEKAQQFASNTIRTLVNAEAALHGGELSDAHLHEVSLVDTPAEIVGAAVAMEDLGLFNAKVYATPVSVGGGLFKFSHGTVSSPAPATLAILASKNFPLKGGPVESELTTPTGAAILVNLAEEVSGFYPEIAPLKVGYGAGNKDFAEMPNVLRVTLGAPLESGLLTDSVVILETNIDDVTGEVIGYSVDRLLREGAKDVCVIPMFTKKNRPGQILKIVADAKDAKRLSRVIIEETGTLGVRVYPCKRHILNRELFSVDVQVDGVGETVKVKVARDIQGKIIQIKPEYEEVKKLAEKKGKPLREIADLITSRTKEILSKKEEEP